MSPEVSLSKNITTVVKLESDLRSLGLVQGDAVMVHASLRNIGPTEERGAGLIKSLLNVLTSNGTIMAYADFEPTPTTPYFDLINSPARPDYGIFAELVRTWPGAVRSSNPGASMVAIGSSAEYLCADHPLNYGYGPGSPLEKFVELNGKVLLLGSDLDQVTLLHYAEHIADIPNKRVVKSSCEIKDSSRVIRQISIEEFDTSKGIVDEMPDRYFESISNTFIETGLARSGVVGGAQSFVFPARQLIEFAVGKLENDFGHNKS